MSRFTLTNRIPKLTQQMRRQASEIVRSTAFEVEGLAKINAPVDTGFLRNSIQATVDNDLQATVTAGAEYSVYIELGTHKMAAQPFLLPAMEAARPGFERKLAQIMT